MHGREGEEWKQRRHMWSVPVLGTATSAAQKQAVTSPLTVPAVDPVQTSPDSFLKDGRKIRVGDCALFQAGNAPPFIGIIRWLSTDREAYLKLCVNWLYRPADVKLAKGILLEAAPNEVFYSFHKDVISAASLLHPCKVAFLCKGVELPLGISSFVCRRVYDIANKCLWWLSDQDYINEHQEEVDQLLDKTRLEMHAAVQSGGRSPKRLNVPSSTQQLKSGSDSVQNNGSSLTSQMKGKKRDRSEQITDSSKRERISKADDGDSSGFKFENSMIKSEISKITEKGALVSTDGVEKLVQLMLVDNGKKIDLTGRVLFADVIAATERIDCLTKFVQIRGVPVLDEWLQEAHKGKIGDGNSPKESDKAVEELLLALLRALDKLPVNLNALQTCNIGKSVNHLRSHKNLEIQKKARSLVDTWKKRVDAEIKTNDAKPTGSSQTVAWPVKPGFSEVSHVGNRRIGSGELSVKGSAAQQTACKGLVAKSVHADATVKAATVVVASGKLQSSVAAVGISPKDSPSKVVGSVGASDPPQVIIKEEKSSSSSQSQNNSQSCSSDQGKTVGSSLKEDARSSTAVSVNATKTSGVSSRHRRSSNGYVASNISGGQKESDSTKSSLLSQNLTSGKILQAGVSCERTGDVPTSDNGLSHRLIVRLPNPGRSPARNTSCGFMEDPVAGSRASSPGVLDKHDHGDCKAIGWNDSSRTPIAADVNAESWQSNDAKDGLVGSDEGNRSSTVIPDEERKPADDSSRVAENYRTACSSSTHEKGPGVTEPNRRKSLSSMNALIESCAKYCEVTTLSGGDDVGMNLLASVAAGEISKKDVVSPATSPRGSLVAEDPCSGTNEAKPTILAVDSSCQNLVQSSEHVDFDTKRHGKDDAPMLVKNEVEEVDTACPLEDNQTRSSMLEDKVTQNDVKQEIDREVELQNHEDKRIDGEIGKSGSESIGPVDKIRISSSVREKNAEDEVTKVEASEADQIPQSGTETGIEVVEGKVEDASTSTVADKIPCPENADTSKRFDGMDGQCHEHSERKDPPILSPGSKAVAGPASSQHDVTNGAEPLRRKRSLENHGTDMGSTIHQEAEACSKMSAADAERKDELASSVEVSTAEQDAVAKLDFDLNEGIIGEDVNQNEPLPTVLPVCSPSVRMSNLSSLVTSPGLAGAPALITVAAPAKGPFRPPENLLKSKGELGWKGSAATSAFRPAEPRKILEMPLNSSDVMSSDNAVPKQGRLPLEIDLNVPDDRAVEDMASQSSAQTTGSESGVISNHDAPLRSTGGLDLDLNLVDEGAENGQFFANSCRRLEVPVMPARSAAEGFQNGEVNILRDFDLNNGPSIDDVVAEPVPRSQSTKICANIPIVTPTSLGMNNANLGSGWFPPGNSYPAVAIPSFLPDRGDHPYPIIAAAGAQRILGSVTGAATIGSEVYRGPVLSSAPALAFSPAATAFSYAGFPFNANFPLASTAFSAGSSNYVDPSSCAGPYFPPIPSPLVGPGGGVSSPFARPYVLSLPEGTASGVSESTRKWARQGLDLNAGPGSTDELKDDRLSSSRQLHAASSHSFMEDPGRLYHVAGGLLKRKEPDGGWESERFTFKQPPLQ